MKSPFIYRLWLAKAYTGAVILQHSSPPRSHSTAPHSSPPQTVSPTCCFAQGPFPFPHELSGAFSLPQDSPKGGSLPASIQSRALYSVSIRGFAPGVKPGPRPHRTLPPLTLPSATVTLKGFPPPPPSGAPATQISPLRPVPPIRQRAAGVGGDSPEGRRPGGRNALTSSPRAPACWALLERRPAGPPADVFSVPARARQSPPTGRAPPLPATGIPNGRGPSNQS